MPPHCTQHRQGSGAHAKVAWASAEWSKAEDADKCTVRKVELKEVMKLLKAPLERKFILASGQSNQ